MHPPQNKILNQKYSVDFNTILGKGATGNVYKGLSLQPYPHSIAVKVIPLKQINNQVTSYLLQCQLQALKAITNIQVQSIIKLKQIIVVDQQCFIAMQLLQGGTLRDYLVRISKMQQKCALIVLEQILQGYKILKDNGIIHRDLKPSNIMFEKIPNKDSLNAKIIDFGYCTMQKIKNKPKMFYNVGSPRYMSPQAYRQNLYTEKSDIWSIGIMFYEMLTGSALDKGKDIPETFKIIRQRGIPIPSKLTKKSKKLLQHMLMYSPSKRATCQQICQLLHEDQYQPQSQIILQLRNQTQLFNQKLQQSSLQNTSLPKRQDIRILSIQKRQQSPQNYKSLKKFQNSLFSHKSNFKNRVTFNQPISPGQSPLITINNKKNQDIRKDRLSPVNSKVNRLSIQKSPTIYTPKKQQNFIFKSTPPVRINITTLQPNSSQRAFHQRVNSITKQNQRYKSRQNFLKSQISQNNDQFQQRLCRIQTNNNFIKNQFNSVQKKTMNSPKKVFQNQYKYSFPTTPQIKSHKDKFFSNFHFNQQQQLKTSLQLTQRNMYDPRSSTAHYMNIPHRKTVPDLTKDQTDRSSQHYLFPMRQIISKIPR